MGIVTKAPGRHAALRDTPIFLDRAVNGLWIQQDMNNVNQFSVQLGFLVSKPSPTPIPQIMLASLPPARPGMATAGRYSLIAAMPTGFNHFF